MRSLSLYKIVLILSVILSLASCDTGYSGDIDPNNEVFNYEYPLKKGNSWEYLVKDQQINFSNDSAAQIIGADTVNYYHLKEICTDTVTVSGELIYKIETWKTARVHSVAEIDTSSYTYKETRFYNNAQNTFWLYGTDNAPYAAPLPILKYDQYIGDSWNYLLDNSYKMIKTINSFTNIGSQRVCLIKSNLVDTESGFSYYKGDSYYSRKGLVKERLVAEDLDLTTPSHPTGGFGSADFVTTQELISTNAK